jgi:hypothetical protein
MTLKIARTRHARLVFIKCGLRVGNFQPAKVRGGAKKGGNPHCPAPCTPLTAGVKSYTHGLVTIHCSRKFVGGGVCGSNLIIPKYLQIQENTLSLTQS